jgi:hypothetical protein
MRRLAKHRGGRELGDVTTLRDPDIMSQLEEKISERQREDEEQVGPSACNLAASLLPCKHTETLNGRTPMATKTQTKTKTQAETEQAADRIRELNEQILDFGRRAGIGFLEAYEQNLQTFADYQDKVGDETKVDWIANVARAQANFTRELTRVYTTTARDLLK